ncbi:phage holin [Bacillus sp. Marseille-P3800]|uniref:phage holin n=1 Tax=Bacillus sp. Marseille-P3800 TaxID=2014782 RepID=UPI000C077152|nr:phage holin [Bacillus sp. Marseille-P3800]
MDILSLLTPSIEQLFIGIASLLATLVTFSFVELRKYVLNWIKTRNDLRSQDLLMRFATQAFAEVENSMKNGEGQEKLNAAISLVSKRARENGLQIDEANIRGAIEEAVLKFNYAI